MKQRQSGFGLVPIIIIIVVALVAVLLVWRFWPAPQPTVTPGATDADQALTDPKTKWSFNGNEWLPDALPPRCGEFNVKSPADVTLASGVLYPGQVRGGNYKPHGGLRFDGKKNEDVTVRAPFDAKLVNASRYIEGGEVQYLFTFVHPCGIAYRLDHLLTLSPELQKVADTLPAAKADNSVTTPFNDPVEVKQGATIATAVGFKKTSNVGFDFGLYDLRTQNEASANATWAAQHANVKEYGWYGVCWLDWLSGDEKTTVKALPAADQAQGKTSDYCK